MKTRTAALAATALFCAGVGIGYAATKNTPALYRGKSSEEAALALVEQAKIQADNGSWERIAVGRVLYLGGHKTEGTAIFDAILAVKHADSDEFRIARVYAEAHEWAKAKPLFDHYVEQNPKDDSGLANVGAYYLLNGDRTTAESLFDRSFERKGDIWDTVSAAGAYLGVPPQE
jgi:tetratricopeptide (TPR) repeat protein